MKIKKSPLTSEKIVGGITKMLLIAEIILLIMTCYSIYLSCQYVAKQREYIQINVTIRDKKTIINRKEGRNDRTT